MPTEGNENRMEMRPSLIIGLGGTGIKAATQIKMDLLEINDRIPDQVRILGFDTVEKNSVKLGGWGKERKPGKHATGPVTLGAGEYVYLGGNVREDAKLVAENQDELCREKWWNVKEYSNVPETVWSLNEGAGQYRQFGRVALYKNLARVITMMEAALRAIQGAANTRSVIIHIMGSLAGGTGAGQFIDTAYLARKIARQVNINGVTIMGYFALVDAFKGTPELNLGGNGVQKLSFDARCYAALLELARLQTSVDPDVQYPMCYVRQAHADNVLNGRMEKKPFDAIYLFDGSRPNKKNLELVPIEWGIAPTIADVVVAQVDSVGGTDITQHITNIDAWRNAAGVDANIPLVGSVGAYSIVLPIYHWVEGWTHSFAQDLLDILAPSEKNLTGTPQKLVRDQFGGKPGGIPGSDDAQKRLGRAQGVFTEFLYYLWEIGRRSLDPNQETSLENELNALSIETWLNKLTENISNPTAKIRLERVLLTDLTQKLIRKGVPNDNWINPDKGSTGEAKAQNVEEDVKIAFNRLVGEEMIDGTRAGGLVKEALDVFKRAQVERFSSIMKSTLEKLMNGEPGQPALIGRAGKLGYVLDMLEALRSHYQQTAKAMGGMQGVSNAKHTIKFAGLGIKVTTLNSSLSEMKNDPGSKGKRTYYITNAEKVLNAHRLEICRRSAGEAATDLVKVLDSLIASFNFWGTRLALGSESEGGIRTAVVQGDTDNTASLEASCNVMTRNVLNDQDAKKYAVEMYDTYLKRNGDQKEILLEKFKWEIQFLGENNLQLKCLLEDQELSIKPESGAKNAERLLQLCRKVFDPAWEELSVMNYLINKYQDEPSPLVKDLRDSNGALLSNNSPSTMPAKFLRVDERARAKAETEFASPQFLDGVNNELKAEMNEAVNQVQMALDNKVVQRNFGISHSQDKFKLTYLFFEDAIQLHKTDYFSSASKHYRAINQFPNWLHIFSAEQNARKFADNLPGALGEPKREFSYKVTHLLENIDLFRLAANCIVYGELSYAWKQNVQGLLIHTARPNSGQTDTQYRLTLVPSGVDTVKKGDQLINKATGSQVDPEHFALSDTSSKPSLFDALQTFVYLGRDRFQTARDFNAANYKRVRDTLQWAIARDLESRQPIANYQADRLGWEPPKKGITQGQIQDVQLMVAQYRKNQAWLKKQKTKLIDEYHIGQSPSGSDLSPEQQREADLLIVLYLVIYEENINLMGQIEEHKGKLAPEVVEDDQFPTDDIPEEDLPAFPPKDGDRYCMNPQCLLYKNATTTKHCPECGSPTKEKEPDLPSQVKMVCVNDKCANYMKEVTGKFCSECGKPSSLPQEAGKKVCANKDCSNYMKEVTGKFCSECGKPPSMLQETGKKVCWNNDCSNYLKEVAGKFCPECGKPPSTK